MGRGRSPSPPRRDRRRSRSRDRDRRRPERRRRSRSRSPYRKRSRSRSPRRRSPARRRSRSHSPDRGRDSGPVVHKKINKIVERPQVTEEELAELGPEEAEMRRMMGFSGFDSTKGKKVVGNDVSAVNVINKRKFRQYMNRRGGFNRPLDFIA